MKNLIDFSGKGQTEHCRPAGQHEYIYQWEQQQGPEVKSHSHMVKKINKYINICLCLSL